MGKATGFLEFARELPVDKDPLERINNWDEFHRPLPEEKLRNQGARCMDCGTPFCHTGELINGMATGCPINNLIPEWNDLIYRGLWKEALDRLHKTNNFPEFTGRVCPAPCEGSCVLGINNPPVTIKNIECSIIDHGWDMGWVVPEPPKTRTGKKVAVIGSGPAGLSAAAQLNKAGHSVTVYERDDRPGGLLMYGIPNMKLDKEKVVLRRIKVLAAEGIKFVCNTEIGKDISPEQLLEENDALILCIGAGKPRDLPIEGRDLGGIHFAMEFLTANTKSVLNSNKEELICAKGKDVVIIGGGDTGTDCVGTSIRHGCKSVTQLEIMPKPPEVRAKNNPWPEYPKIYRLDYGQEEAAAKFGHDPRVYTTTATKFEADDQGNVAAVHTVEVEWQRNEQGRFIPQPIEGTQKRIPAQLVLLAMGFLGPEQMLLEKMGLESDVRSNIKADYGQYATNLPKVFAAGDCRRGQSLVVWAFNEGREVARECDRFLMQKTNLP
ncbi:glutamate synthase subunit beta [Cyanobacterium aponinum UTEX 3222]|uniref:glutamate synthase subunit beta n=1 Tax=Cyanobacterium aponinum TaxID=379064 RepID=UPI002B4C057C|nr:glutamate synthase subunit beta [Cyanobacterium aponinum]WRL36849.1 glutamate synthase subunit beta [Cyanobacterium aponinum UTEX 3221]WRL43177.1 glutamate synthase subunit beta [Cyanobacterium aponinum UTEX 3222]